MKNISITWAEAVNSIINKEVPERRGADGALFPSYSYNNASHLYFIKTALQEARLRLASCHLNFSFLPPATISGLCWGILEPSQSHALMLSNKEGCNYLQITYKHIYISLAQSTWIDTVRVATRGRPRQQWSICRGSKGSLTTLICANKSQNKFYLYAAKD